MRFNQYDVLAGCEKLSCCARARFKTPTLTDSAVCLDLHTLTGDLGVVKAGVYLTTSCQPRFRSCYLVECL